MDGLPGVTLHEYRAARRRLSENCETSETSAAALQQRLARAVGLGQPSRRPRQQLRRRNTDGSSARSDDGTARSIIQRAASAQQAAFKELEEPSTPKMSADEWTKVEAAVVQRDDLKHGCPICLEGFGATDTLLLSCSHTFHKACLESVERCLPSLGRYEQQKPQEKRCPICRKTRYESRTTDLAADDARRRAATTLNKAARGLIQRRAHRSRLHGLYSTGGGDESLRRRFLERELSRHTAAALAQHTSEDDSIDALLAESDMALGTSKLVFGASPPREQRPPPPPPRQQLSANEWLDAERRAVLIAEQDCAVCLGRLVGARSRVLLGCAHVFHASCLGALEAFSIRDDLKLCPCCRASYDESAAFPLNDDPADLEEEHAPEDELGRLLSSNSSSPFVNV